MGAAAPRQGEGAPGYWDRARTGAPGCWLGPWSLERGAEGRGDGRVRLRRGRGKQGGPRRDLPVPRAASLGRLESLLSFSPGRAPPGAKLVVFLLFLLLLHHLLRLLLLL